MHVPELPWSEMVQGYRPNLPDNASIPCVTERNNGAFKETLTELDRTETRPRRYLAFLYRLRDLSLRDGEEKVERSYSSDRRRKEALPIASVRKGSKVVGMPG